jgi:hypothetical protein
MKYLYGKELQDGDPRLTQNNTGRITIYKDCISWTKGPSRDHNDLLRSMIAEWGLQKERDAVLSNASRYYYIREGDKIIVSPVRRTDDEDFSRCQASYTKLIVRTVK